MMGSECTRFNENGKGEIRPVVGCRGVGWCGCSRNKAVGQKSPVCLWKWACPGSSVPLSHRLGAACVSEVFVSTCSRVGTGWGGLGGAVSRESSSAVLPLDI